MRRRELERVAERKDFEKQEIEGKLRAKENEIIYLN